MPLTLEIKFYDSSKFTQISTLDLKPSSKKIKASLSLHLMLSLSQMQLLQIPVFMTRDGGWKQQRDDSGTSHHGIKCGMSFFASTTLKPPPLWKEWPKNQISQWSKLKQTIYILYTSKNENYKRTSIIQKRAYTHKKI